METTKIQAIQVNCKKCKHKWLYTRGKPEYRIRCPKCHSSKNDLNSELFGVWTPWQSQHLLRNWNAIDAIRPFNSIPK